MPHVVIADNEPLVAEFVQRALGRLGWTADITTNGNVAFHLVIAKRPQLVISGVSLLGLDGLALVQAIRSHPQLTATPVILMSAWIGAEEALAAGANGFLPKPFRLAELEAVVSQVLNEAGPD